MKTAKQWRLGALGSLEYAAGPGIVACAWWALNRMVPGDIGSVGEVSTFVRESHESVLLAVRETAGQAALGLLIAAGAGVALGVTAVLWKRLLGRTITLLAVSLKATPVVAFIPLVQIWVGTYYSEKVIVAAIISFFPIFAGFTSGVDEVPERLRLLKVCYGAPERRFLRQVALVYAAQGITDGLRTAAPLAVVGAVVAGALGGDFGGVGGQLGNIPTGKGGQRMAWILCASGVGLLFYACATGLHCAFRRRLRLTKL